MSIWVSKVFENEAEGHIIKKRIDRARYRKERRRDEESLYYILERDIDREVIFREHDGWVYQVPSGKGKIDYAVKYGNNVHGVEVKFSFPKIKDFE